MPSSNTDGWKTIERLCTSFTEFARSGDPNNDTIAPVQWKPVTLDDQKLYKCLNMAKEVSFVDMPEHDRMLYWDSIYKQFNRNPI